MANLPSIEDKINDLEVGGDKVLSEILQRRYGTNINSLIDKTDAADANIASIQSSLTDVIDFRTVSASPTPVAVKTTLYTVPASRTATVQLKYENLPNAAGTASCSIFISHKGLEVSYNAVDISNPNYNWINNGAGASDTGGTILEALHMGAMHLVAGDTIAITRNDRGALGLEITEFKELV